MVEIVYEKTNHNRIVFKHDFYGNFVLEFGQSKQIFGVSTQIEKAHLDRINCSMSDYVNGILISGTEQAIFCNGVELDMGKHMDYNKSLVDILASFFEYNKFVFTNPSPVAGFYLHGPDGNSLNILGFHKEILSDLFEVLFPEKFI